MRTVKRVVAIMMAATIMVFGAAFLSGCAQENSEDIIRQGVADELDVIKNLNDETLSELVSQSGAESLSEFGIDANEFIKSYLDGFDYRIESVNVEGDSATATVVLSCKSYSEFSNGVNDIMTSMSSGEGIEGMTMDEVYQEYGNRIMELLDSIQVSETEPIELNFEKTDNTWAPTADAEQAISSALFGI